MKTRVSVGYDEGTYSKNFIIEDGDMDDLEDYFETADGWKNCFEPLEKQGIYCDIINETVDDSVMQCDVESKEISPHDMETQLPAAQCDILLRAVYNFTAAKFRVSEIYTIVY